MDDKDQSTLINIGTIVVVVFVLYGFYAWNNSGEGSSLGTFGDSFGVINALFSGVGLIAVAITLFIQSKELKLQREELQNHREEFSRMADIQERAVEMESLTARSEFELENTAVLSAMSMLLKLQLAAKEQVDNYASDIEVVLTLRVNDNSNSARDIFVSFRRHSPLLDKEILATAYPIMKPGSTLRISVPLITMGEGNMVYLPKIVVHYTSMVGEQRVVEIVSTINKHDGGVSEADYKAAIRPSLTGEVSRARVNASSITDKLLEKRVSHNDFV